MVDELASKAPQGHGIRRELTVCVLLRIQSRERSAQELQDWNDEDLIVDRAEAEAYERERVARERRHIEEREKEQASNHLYHTPC